VTYRTLGKSGLEVSAVGLGCNNFGMRIDLDAARKVVHKALDLGVTLFDTADIYGNMGGSETMLGQILGERRKDIVLATKFSGPMAEGKTRRDTSRRYIMTAVEASLKRLKTEWIDLYQLHFPDPLTPIQETLGALDDLVHHGKVRYIGCSNLAAWQVVEAQWTSRHLGVARFISCQDEYSLLVRDMEREKLPAIEAYGLGLLPYFPLASGMLTGKYRRDRALEGQGRLGAIQQSGNPGFLKLFTERNWQIVDALVAVATELGRSPAQVALSWVARRPAVASTIIGATKPSQLDDNLAALSFELPEPLRRRLDEATRPETVHPYHFFEPGMQQMMTGGTRVSIR
jgi:aryl-alcohol dehydrogenase-like predicted oxidoreductase